MLLLEGGRACVRGTLCELEKVKIWIRVLNAAKRHRFLLDSFWCFGGWLVA